MNSRLQYNLNNIQAFIESTLLRCGPTQSKLEVIWATAWNALQPWSWITRL